MEDVFKQVLWKNFEAAIDMLANAVRFCPEELWIKRKKFYYLTYHTTIFLDYYLTYPVCDFQPMLSYTVVNTDQLPPESIDDVIPDRLYHQHEILAYLLVIKEKCKKLILQTPNEKLTKKWIEKSEINLHGLCPAIVVDYNVLEILFYNFRHVAAPHSSVEFYPSSGNKCGTRLGGVISGMFSSFFCYSIVN